jgi:hypothetical protein
MFINSTTLNHSGIRCSLRTEHQGNVTSSGEQTARISRDIVRSYTPTTPIDRLTTRRLLTHDDKTRRGSWKRSILSNLFAR